jgi:hypothetical protein
MIKVVKFICSECNNNSIEVVESLIETTEVICINSDNTYCLTNPSSSVKQEVIRFQCTQCGFVLKDNDNVTDSFEDLTEFLIKS